MSLIQVNTIQNANGTTALIIAANGQLSRVNTAIISDGTNSTSATNVIQGSAKAWVSFNGAGTVAINGSYNVSSITDGGTGIYTVNFTTAMPDTNYSVITSSFQPATTGATGAVYALGTEGTLSPTTTSVTVWAKQIRPDTCTFLDNSGSYVAIFR